MMRSVGLAMLFVGVTSVAAADVADDYRRAFAEVYPGDRSNAVEATLRGIDMIPQLEGDWAAAYLLMSDDDYSRRMIERGCETIPITITQVSPLEFTLTYNLRDGSNYSTRFANIGGRYFQPLADMSERIHVFGSGTPFEDMPDDRIIATFLDPSNHAVTRLELHGPDVLVLEPVGGQPSILARCP